MHRFRSTPRLATPGILLNQQVINHNWSRLRHELTNPPSIKHDDDGVKSPLVIKEAIQSLEQALIEPGDTPIDFMVVATALQYQFADHHVRLFRDGSRRAVHFVSGQWAILADPSDDASVTALSGGESSQTQSQSSRDHSSSSTRSDVSESVAHAEQSTVDLVPRPARYVFQALCGCRIGIDLVAPEDQAPQPND